MGNRWMVVLGLLLIIGTLSSFASASVYAGETLKKKLPEMKQLEKGIVPDIPDLPGKYVHAEVLDNTDTCLINCEIILNITSDIILIPSDVKASFKDVNGKEQMREYTYEHLVQKTRAVDCPEYSTEEINYTVYNNATGENETVYENITVTDWVFCGLENYTVWEDGLPLVAAGDSAVIKIKGKKLQHENIDVIPELYGIKFDKWAWWNSSDAKMDYWIDDTNTSLWGKTNITNGTIGMYYYGNCTKASESNASEVGILFYLSGDTGYTDTAGGCAITNSGTTLTNDSGRGVFVFDGSDYITIGESCSNSLSAGTLLLTLKTTDLGTQYNFFAKSSASFRSQIYGANKKGVYFDVLGGTTTCSINDDTYDWSSEYRNISFAWDNSKSNIFVEETKETSDCANSDATPASGDLYLGHNSVNTNERLKGRIQRAILFDTYRPFYSIGVSYGTIETGSFDDGQGNTCGYKVGINITATEDIADYQVELNYTELGESQNGTLTFYYEGNPPVLISDELGPASLYKNTTAWGAVSYNHTTNTTYTAYQGLAINGAIVGGFNQTNPTYSNGTTWNYTSYDISAYTHGDNVSLWSYANVTNESGDASAIAYTANITIGNYGPDIENLTITSPIYNDTNATGTADLWDLEGDVINCQFNWYVNDSSIYNDTQAPCTNTSTFNSGNYSETDIIHFGINATDSYGGSSAQVNSSSVTVAGAFTFNNYTYTTPQYETVRYNYSLNFSISAGDENVSVELEYHDTNITADCSNVSEVYYCTITNLQAYPITTNATTEEAKWWVEYDSLLAGAVTEDQDFTVTIYDGIWPTNITSEAEAIEQLATNINVSYGYASGIQGRVSGTALLGSSSGSFTCSAGDCGASVTAPDVETPALYQTEANLTLTSSYWAETSTKEVRIENNFVMEPATSGSCSGGSNCANGYDGDWGSYYQMSGDGHINLTFALGTNYYLDSWTVKDYDATSTKTPVDDCIGPNPIFQFEEWSSWDAYYKCLNQSDDTWITLDSDPTGAHGYRFFESNLTYSQNNSLTWVVPYGLTDCTSGEPLFNYSCRDEDTDALITCNYSQTFTIESAAGETYETFSGEAQNWNVCFYPETLEANISSIEQVGATGYDDREFFLINAATGNNSYNLYRYLLNDAQGKFTIITVRENGVGLEDAYVYCNKYWVDSNTFTTVAMVKTDDDGRGATYLVPNTAWYRFSVVYEGETVHTSTTQHVICEESAYTCYVTLDVEDESVDHWTYYEDISGGCAYQNATKRLVCDWADATGVMQYVNLTASSVGVTATTLLCSNSSTSQSGTIFCDIPESFTGTFSYSFWGKYNPEYYLDSGSVNLGERNIWGDNGILVAILVFIVLAGVGVWSPPAGILMGLLALVALYTLGILDSESGLGALAGIGVAGIIAALRMRE